MRKLSIRLIRVIYLIFRSIQMNTEVYVFCSKCKEVVDGIGSGDLKDMITCNKCGYRIVANSIGLFEPFLIKGGKKRLYLPED